MGPKQKGVVGDVSAWGRGPTSVLNTARSGGNGIPIVRDYLPYPPPLYDCPGEFSFFKPIYDLLRQNTPRSFLRKKYHLGFFCHFGGMEELNHKWIQIKKERGVILGGLLWRKE